MWRGEDNELHSSHVEFEESLRSPRQKVEYYTIGYTVLELREVGEENVYVGVVGI